MILFNIGVPTPWSVAMAGWLPRDDFEGAPSTAPTEDVIIINSSSRVSRVQGIRHLQFGVIRTWEEPPRFAYVCHDCIHRTDIVLCAAHRDGGCNFLDGYRVCSRPSIMWLKLQASLALLMYYVMMDMMLGRNKAIHLISYILKWPDTSTQ